MTWRPATIVALWLAITAAPALAAAEEGSPEAVQKQFETMQQTMNKMHTTQDTGELNALMQQHMAEMMSGMQMMNRMMGSGMMGGKAAGMMGGQSGGMMGGQSGGMMGGHSAGSTDQGSQATNTMADMQQRMSMMWGMMNQMMQHMQEQQRLDQPKK